MNSTIDKIGLAQHFKTRLQKLSSLVLIILQSHYKQQDLNILHFPEDLFLNLFKVPLQIQLVLQPYDLNKTLDITKESQPNIGFTKEEKLKPVKSVEKNLFSIFQSQGMDWSTTKLQWCHQNMLFYRKKTQRYQARYFQERY